MLTIGYGNSFIDQDSNFSFNIDVGASYTGGLKGSVKTSSEIPEATQLTEDVNEEVAKKIKNLKFFKFWPLFNIGFQYRF